MTNFLWIIAYVVVFFAIFQLIGMLAEKYVGPWLDKRHIKKCSSCASQVHRRL